MITETTAVTLRQNLGNMLNRVQYRRESIVITKDGKLVAALVAAALFSRFHAMQERFDALCDRLGVAAEAERGAKTQAEIEWLSAAVRHQVAKDWRKAGRLQASQPAVRVPESSPALYLGGERSLASKQAKPVAAAKTRYRRDPKP